MVSATNVLSRRLGERNSVQQVRSGDHNEKELLERQEQGNKDFLYSCARLRGSRNVEAIIGDPAIVNFGKLTRLEGLSEASVATYLAGIQRACSAMKSTPSELVAELKQLETTKTQAWFDQLAEFFLFRKEKPVRGSTMRSIHDALMKLMEANGVKREVKARFKIRTRRPIPFTRDEVKAVFKEVSYSRRKTLWVWLLAQSFARVGLLWSLTLGDFIPLIESGVDAGLIWIDGEQRRTKERISHDLPISPEALRAAKSLIAEIEEEFHVKITKENGDNYPVVAYVDNPTRRVDYKSFMVEFRRLVRRTGVQGASIGTGTDTRYTKDVHTGFRGFCFTQWKGQKSLAKWFAGQKPPLDDYSYTNYAALEPKQKIAEYLRARPQPFDDGDMLQEACAYLGNLGFNIDSKTREQLKTRLLHVSGGERETRRPHCAGCPRQNSAPREQQEEGEDQLYDLKRKEFIFFQHGEVVQFVSPSSPPLFLNELVGGN
jgi:integrase